MLMTVTACGNQVPSSATTRMTAARTVAPAGTQFPADVISPLIIGGVAPDPTPVKGSDDRYHVAYELTVLNFAPRPVTIISVETLAPDGGVVTALTQEQVARRTMIVADYATPAAEVAGSGAASRSRARAGDAVRQSALRARQRLGTRHVAGDLP
jgi:hypothetical protein